MNIIGFSGIEGSGKDSAAEFAAEWANHRGLTTKRQGFADILKESAALSLGAPPGMPREEYVNFCNALKLRGSVTVDISLTSAEKAADLPVSVEFSGRDYLRWYGTEAHRSVFGEQFWTDALFEEQVQYVGSLDLLLIPDVRFDNEARAVLAQDGLVVEVHRPGVQAVGNHVSESGISDELLSCSIRNDTDLDGLRGGVYSTLSGLLNERL